MKTYQKPFRWPVLFAFDPGKIYCGHCVGLAEARGEGMAAVEPVIVRRWWDTCGLECPQCTREWEIKPTHELWVDAVQGWIQGEGNSDGSRQETEVNRENV